MERPPGAGRAHGQPQPGGGAQNLYATDAPERWLAISCATDGQFRALAAVIGHPELTADPGLSTLADRRAGADRLDELIGAWAAAHPLDEAVAMLLEAGVPAAPATDQRRTAFHQQLVARGYAEEVDHPVVGPHPTPGLPFRFASVERWIRRPAPTLGQHNAEVLGCWLGHPPDELAALEAQGVIGTWPEGA